jgi:hypothetical protein
LNKIRALEKEKSDKERRIQDLLDEKQRIHNQWADDRRSLDHRVRALEQNLRHITQSNGYTNTGFNSSLPANDTQLLLQSMNYAQQRSPRAAVLHDSTMQKMEELRLKIADRRSGSSGINTRPR